MIEVLGNIMDSQNDSYAGYRVYGVGGVFPFNLCEWFQKGDIYN